MINADYSQHRKTDPIKNKQTNKQTKTTKRENLKHKQDVEQRIKHLM